MEDGTIVDPTSGQFAFKGGDYEEYDPSRHGPEPVGKCIECGELAYNSELLPFCSSSCNEGYIALTRRRRSVGCTPPRRASHQSNEHRIKEAPV